MISESAKKKKKKEKNASALTSPIFAVTHSLVMLFSITVMVPSGKHSTGTCPETVQWLVTPTGGLRLSSGLCSYVFT